MAIARPLITKRLRKVLDRKSQLLGPANQQLVTLLTLKWFISLLARGGTQTWGPFCNRRLHLVISHSAFSNSTLRDRQNDLTRDQLWDKISDLLKEGYILIVSPPCNTFSRARFQWLRRPGPRPLRNVNWPKGFPWHSSKNKAVVEEANSFIFRCIAACLICHQSGGKYFWEHPEDLGEVHSEHPASIWQWPEMRDLLVQTNATTFAIQQCHFGADTPKPTRFLTTLSTDDSRCHFGWPQFSSNAYCGPLPKSCGTSTETHWATGWEMENWSKCGLPTRTL